MGEWSEERQVDTQALPLILVFAVLQTVLSFFGLAGQCQLSPAS